MDASVLVEVVRGRREVIVGLTDAAHAPQLIDAEVLHGLRRLARAGELDDEDGRRAIQRLERLPLERHPPDADRLRVWELRANVTAHDACYVALAERLGCPLVTLDGRLARATGPRCEIRIVG